MARKIADDGQISTYLNEFGQEIHVPNTHDPFAGSTDLSADVAPVGGAPAPEEILQFPPDDLSMPQPGVDQVTSVPVAAEVAPAAPPPAQPPPPAPPIEQPPPPPPPEPVQPPLSVLPEGPLNTPTQVAGAVNQSAQDQASSLQRTAQATDDVSGQMINASKDADYQVQEYEKQRAAELQQRQADEAELVEQHGRMVDRYANWKADPTRGISSGRQTLAWIGAAIAGFAQAMQGNGTKNPALDGLLASLDKNVQLQMAERDGLGTAIGMKKDAISDFRAVTKTRMGEYDLRMAAALERAAKETERLKVRLGSVQEKEAATQAVAALRAEAAARQGAAVASEAEARAKARAARASAQAAQVKAAERRAEFQATKGVMWDAATQSYVPDPRFADPNEALDTQGKILANEKARRELTGQTPDDARTSLAREKDTAARTLNGFDGKPLTRTVVQKGADGKEVKTKVPVMAKDDTAATYLTTAGAAVDKLTRASDLIKQLRAAHGGSIKTLGTAEAQKLNAVVQDIDLNNLVARNMGVPTGKDMEIVEGLRGGVDPAAFLRDPTVGIEAMATRAIENYNADLRQKSDYFDNADGAEPLKPPRSAAAKVAETRPDQRVAALTKGDPSVKGDAAATARDAEYRLEAVKVFLQRDKPSPETIDEVMRQVSADKSMPATTRASILATLKDAKDKTETPVAKHQRKLDEIAKHLPGDRTRLIPEELLFGLPKKGAK